MEVKKGFVVMFDALGTKLKDIAACDKFIKDTDNLKEYLSKRAEQKEVNNLDIIILNDTIILLLESDLTFHNIKVIGKIVRPIIKRGLENKILYRGAISFGEYIIKYSDKRVQILGPAITDVADWYEEINMAGLVATPYFTRNIGYMLSVKNKEAANLFEKLYFCKHGITYNNLEFGNFFVRGI